ncbi:hypothetical protein CAOG_04657 [Capsaspora owczarzaki ATCC 30864]|uniref:Tyrosine phosphatase n=1 Tax=Capsaspora owczarzaki (strain ATCC 30864) TaxID=595528 RepID=A0A0D2VSA8_CAPO3|nr:hypothetical protein CAOG_04657 [Capsaspora owczarzaki ATCC 30864]KJE93947.1 hypothetical protein CAOG_004657 [Capsaspora owczarzaki ATCC 30864]|eukprot:XP_004347404.1 hypothetical protein CAOG_04657 [Capsaspora owczarzaki ATCC 30864]
MRGEPLIPPFRFTIVDEQVYRGAYPTHLNFAFLARLKLKTVLSLTPKKPDSNIDFFCKEEGVQNIFIQVDKFKENVTLTHQHIVQILPILLNASCHPIYIHCLDGANVTGLVVMFLRRIQQWTVASAVIEFARYTRDGLMTPDELELVETFRMDTVRLEKPLPTWMLLRSPAFGFLPAESVDQPRIRTGRLRDVTATDNTLDHTIGRLARSCPCPLLLDVPPNEWTSKSTTTQMLYGLLFARGRNAGRVYWTFERLAVLLMAFIIVSTLLGMVHWRQESKLQQYHRARWQQLHQRAPVADPDEEDAAVAATTKPVQSQSNQQQQQQQLKQPTVVPYVDAAFKLSLGLSFLVLARLAQIRLQPQQSPPPTHRTASTATTSSSAATATTTSTTANAEPDKSRAAALAASPLARLTPEEREKTKRFLLNALRQRRAKQE